MRANDSRMRSLTEWNRRYGALAGMAIAMAMVLLAVTLSRRPTGAVVQATAGLTSRADSVAMASVLGRVLTQDSDSAVQTLRAFASYGATWSAAAKQRASEIERLRGLSHFKVGQVAFSQGKYADAARELSWAVTYGAGSDYHANAMYLLARTHARSGQPASARLEAQELLRQYPKSRFADGLMKRVATTGSEQ